MNNFASYKPGTFSTDVSNLRMEGDFFVQEDIPAFMHEYCHYIQDISTVSAIFGFSLLMRDIVALTQIFSDGEGREITIPLPLDANGQPINKFRRFYSMYCGNPQDVFDLDFRSNPFKKRSLKVEEIDLDGQKRKMAINLLQFENSSSHLQFGLIALQEIQAFYAQKQAEMRLGDLDFRVPTTSMKSYPYKLGEELFEHYKITTDIETKYILIDFCLDTVQAPTIFLDVLEKIQNSEYYFHSDKGEYIKSIVDECNSQCSYSKEIALENILPDLKMWAIDPTRKYLSEALTWYVDKIELSSNLKKYVSPSMFSLSFCRNWESFVLFYKCFPSPVFIRSGVFYRHISEESNEFDSEFEVNFKEATTLWAHKVIYDFLTSRTGEEIRTNAVCPLYENCTIKEQIGREYTCKQAPWELIREESNLKCQYGMAAHSFGLWQNSLRLDI